MDFPIEICVSLTIFLLMLINTQAVVPEKVILSISTSAKINDSAEIFCNGSTSARQYGASFRHNHDDPVNIICEVKNPQAPNMALTVPLNQIYYQYNLGSLFCSDRGNYSCIVMTDTGDMNSNSVTLDVLGPAGRPNLTVPSDIQVLGDHVTVFCESNVGKPAQNLNLCIGNSINKNIVCATQNQPVEHVEECIFRRNASLTFQVTIETYMASCIVGSSSLKSEKTWEIDYTQAVEPHWVTFSISTTAKINDSAQLFCNATTPMEQYAAVFIFNNAKSAPIYSQEKGKHPPNTNVSGSHKRYYYQYTLSSLSCSDRGSYSCTVMTNVVVIRSNSVTLDVRGPVGRPNLTVPYYNQVLGNHVTVFCESNVGRPAQDLNLCVGNSINKNVVCAIQNQPVEQVEECIFRRNASLTFQVSKETHMVSCIVGSSSLKSEQNWKIGLLSRGPRSQPNLFLAATIFFVVSWSHIYGT